jgi:hypothetical protein
VLQFEPANLAIVHGTHLFEELSDLDLKLELVRIPSAVSDPPTRIWVVGLEPAASYTTTLNLIASFGA